MSEEAKQTKGKPHYSYIPPAVLDALVVIREYGTHKYGDPDNWRNVPVAEYKEALLRHTRAIMEDLWTLDPESGYPHIWHAACNAAFIISMIEYDSELYSPRKALEKLMKELNDDTGEV